MSSYKKYRVIKKVKESSWVVSLYLKLLDNTVPAPFKPGQHLLFKIHPPGQEIPLFRHYSFSDAYHPEYYRISVKKEFPPPGMLHLPAGVCSSWLFDTVQEGDVLEARGPLGEFTLDTGEGSPVVMIAGGIGITPILSMLKSVARENPGRQVWFFYGVNGKDEHSFSGELNELKERYSNFHITTFYTKTLPGDITGSDYDHEGFVNAAIILKQTGHGDISHYMCGPEIMMRLVGDELVRQGIAGNNIHTETFSSLAGGDVPAPAAPGEGDYMVHFTLTGRKLHWDNRYTSILTFAEANDIEISSGCLFGDCGTCLTRILEGDVKYTHPTMVKPDGGSCLPCSCVPAGNIVLKA
jgi:ferredoxin-NADP reductase